MSIKDSRASIPSNSDYILQFGSVSAELLNCALAKNYL